MRGKRVALRLGLTMCLLTVSLVAVPATATAAVTPMVSAGAYHTVGLRSDGTVVVAGGSVQHRLDVSGWSNIVSVAAGGRHTVGLRSDGTVVAVGDNPYGQLDVSGWSDIVSVAAGEGHTVGLRSDGTVVAVGSNAYGQLDVSGMDSIVAVAAGVRHTVGLRSDGTVVAVGDNTYNQLDVGGWTDVVAISAGWWHTVGLRSDGTVVAVGSNDHFQLTLTTGGIVAVDAGYLHTVALRSDGTVVAVGDNAYNQLDVGGWTDIVAVAGGMVHTVGLRSDGTVVAAGRNDFGELDVSGWNLGATITEPPGPGSSTSISVTADVPAPPPSLTFTVSRGAAPEGGSVTAFSIGFGMLEPNTAKMGSHLLAVTTNAASGYTVTAQEASPLAAGSDLIPDVTGDDGDITHITAGAWEQSTAYGFGYTLQNTSGTDAAVNYGEFKAFADVSAAAVPQAVMSAAGPVTASEVELTYKLNVAPTQPQGAYSTTVTYVATGTF